MKFCEILFEIRKQKGLSQEELADKLNVSRQTISKWETGQTTPEMDKLIEMSKLFNISVDELVGNTKINEESKDKESVEENQKEIKKKHGTLYKIIRAIIIIYLLISLYKFIATSIISSIGNSFSEENYMIMQSLKVDYGLAGSYENSFEFIKKGNIFIERAYNFKESEEPYYIVYTEIDKRSSIRLNYNKEMEKYVVSNEDIHVSEKDLEEKYKAFDNNDYFKSLASVSPNSIKYRLMISFNPFTYISLLGKKEIHISPFDMVSVREYNNDYLIRRIINKNWGTNDYFEIICSYDYVQDHFENITIENPLEQYKDKIVYENDL